MWKQLKTIKEKQEYIKNILNKGLCSSLKNERNDDFNDCIEIFKLHPDKNKLEGVVDICIISNKKNFKYYEFNLIKEDKTKISISYRECFKKTSIEHNLNTALRVAIEPQIEYFKKNVKNWQCELCNSNNEIHIDHIILFNDLKKRFFIEKNETIIYIPNMYDYDNYNRAIFKKEDEEFKNKWFEFHKENAKLRCLCKECNLTRKKTTLKEDIKKNKNPFINDD